MAYTVTVNLPAFLYKPVDELTKFLDQVDPPKTKGAPRKVSNRELATQLVMMTHTGQSWRYFDANDTRRKRFIKLRNDKAFELFLQLCPQAKTLWEN